MYLSYLMGADEIQDQDLISLGIIITEKTKSGDRKLHIPHEKIQHYKKLIKEKLSPGFWNDFLDEREVYFIFKFGDGETKEYILSPENERGIDQICAQLIHQSPKETPNVYRFLSENEFYHDFMIDHYRSLIDRSN